MAESFWIKHKELIRALPNKKQYIEFFTAILSVPIMLTVLVLNINNLKPKDPSPITPEEKKEVIVVSPEIRGAATTTLPTEKKEACTEDLPGVEIVTPESEETVSKQPVCISPKIEEGDYCSVVWRYNVNNTSWSEYDNKGFCLYNLPSGHTTVRLQVKSIVTGEEKEIIREFTYAGPITTPSPTVTDSSTASSSAQ